MKAPIKSLALALFGVLAAAAAPLAFANEEIYTSTEAQEDFLEDAWNRPESGCVSNLGLEDRWCQKFNSEQLCGQHRVRCHWR